jgi:hypothetical protein
MDFLREFWLFMRSRKKFWLLPLLIIMTIFGVLVLFTESSVVAPFIYTFF